MLAVPEAHGKNKGMFETKFTSRRDCLSQLDMFFNKTSSEKIGYGEAKSEKTQ